MTVKDYVDCGVPFPTAVRLCLTEGIDGFARARGLSATGVSGTINGSSPYPYERTRDELAKRLDVDRAWLDEQIRLTRNAALSAKAKDS